jgi:hypothetical protein
MAGHSSIVVTAGTYTSVFPDSQRRCADAAAALVLAATRYTRKTHQGKGGQEQARRTRRKTNAFRETAPSQEEQP